MNKSPIVAMIVVGRYCENDPPGQPHEQHDLQFWFEWDESAWYICFRHNIGFEDVFKTGPFDCFEEAKKRMGWILGSFSPATLHDFVIKNHDWFVQMANLEPIVDAK